MVQRGRGNAGKDWGGDLRALAAVFDHHHNHNGAVSVLSEASKPGMREVISPNLSGACFPADDHTLDRGFGPAALGNNSLHHLEHNPGCFRFHQVMDHDSTGHGGCLASIMISFLVDQIGKWHLAVIVGSQNNHAHVQGGGQQLALANRGDGPQQVILRKAGNISRQLGGAEIKLKRKALIFRGAEPKPGCIID